MTLARRGLIASVLGLLGGCSPAALLNTTVSRSGYRLEADIPYGNLPRQKLDVYTPEQPRADAKSVIFFYGGSWDSGAKGDYLFVGQALAALGITTIIPDYRVYPEVRYPAFLDDGAAATAWAANKVGTEKLFVAGHSAGAYIAIMMVANTPYLAAAGVDRMKLPGGIGIAGPYDFLPLTSRRLQEIFGGPNRRETQPIEYARAPLPPLLLLHGTADTTVKPFNSERLAAAWRKAGARAELKLYPEVDHIDIVGSFSALLRKRAPTLDDTISFIDRM
ncbi:MAG: alpha/beta hydrolase [Reyranella sp.]|uniref:alpha/beta hydrolase n=1 Tax=Reyranella sp. TaxID=1929291 RepID=UPI00121F8AAB|nr:alpha/beta hydrolase [Reyranella sp.]TAJ96557.1 MAG: alpha/beta hydrolase [Reyranella sp.]TBR28455.1 MAG: alpha/beta hydrolase [Reyranella sp.]